MEDAGQPIEMVARYGKWIVLVLPGLHASGGMGFRCTRA